MLKEELKLNTTINLIIKEIVVLPINAFLNNIKQLFNRNKIKAIIWLLVIILPIIISLVLLKNINFNIHSDKQVYTSNIKSVDKIPVSIGGTDELSPFLSAYKSALEFFKPIFEGFISTTADPTGKVTKKGSSYYLDLNGSSRVTFNNGDTSLASSSISIISLDIALPILVFLILINSFNYIYGTEKDPDQIKDFIKRILTTIIILILSPFILSISILVINLITDKFTNGQPLTSFISNFLSNITITQSQTTATVPNGLNFLNFDPLGLKGTISSIPTLVPLAFILILFLFVSFQFIIRFLNIFFLACIYPFAMIFYISPKTSNIPEAYWKYWVTFLIHQPSFVIGYVIIQNILNDMLSVNGPNFVQVLLFVGLLIFLSSVNILTAGIFGDIYAAVSTNIQAGIATGFTKSFVFHKATGGGRGGTSGLGKGHSSNHKPTGITGHIFNHPTSLLSQAKKGIYLMRLTRKVGKRMSTMGIFADNSTKVTNSLVRDKIGFRKLIADHAGNLSLNGNFYKHTDKDTGLSVLYPSILNATRDGVDKNSLKEVSLKNFEVKDLTNSRSAKKYNENLELFALQSKLKIPKLYSNPSMNKLSANLNKAAGFNDHFGIKGFIFEKNNKYIAGSPEIVKVVTNNI